MIVKIGEDFLATDHPQDALIYLEIGANEESIKAYELLIKAYDEGIGVLADAKKAFDYCLKAANLNDPRSMAQLAEKYELGRGVDSSFVLAARWYEKASLAGYEPAKTSLVGLRGY